MYLSTPTDVRRFSQRNVQLVVTLGMRMTSGSPHTVKNYATHVYASTLLPGTLIHDNDVEKLTWLVPSRVAYFILGFENWQISLTCRGVLKEIFEGATYRTDSPTVPGALPMLKDKTASLKRLDTAGYIFEQKG